MIIYGLDATALRFSEANGNRRTGKTGQLAKLAQPLSFYRLWYSRLSAAYPKGPGYGY